MVVGADAVFAGPDAAPSWEYLDTLDGSCRFVDCDALSWATYSSAAAPNYLDRPVQRGRRYFPGVQAPKTICAEAPSVAISITLPLTLDIVALHPR